MDVKKIVLIALFFMATVSVSAQISTWARSDGGLVRKVKVINNSVYACGGSFLAKYSLTGNLIWVINFTGVIHAYDIAVSNGSVYITGSFLNSVNFDPQGNNVLTSNGSFDVFVGRYSDADGSYVYAKNFGGPSGDVGNSIEVDSDNNIYVGGEFSSSVNFSMSGGNNTVNSNDNLNVKGFLAKYIQPAENVYGLAWVNTFLGNDINEVHNSNVYASAIDESSGIIYVSGFFSGSNTNFNAAQGSIILSPTQSSGLNNQNAFIASYSVNTGKCANAKNLLSPYSSVARDISYYNGDVYIVGDLFANSVININFDLTGGNNSRSTTGARNDIFFAKYSATSFSFGFANILGCGTTAPPQPPMSPTQKAIAGNGIDVNATGVYITGGFTGTTDFDPGIGTSNFTATGAYRDIFYGRYTLTGLFAGAQKIGSTGDDAGYTIASTNGADFYAGGLLGTANTDMDPGPGSILLSSGGFIAGYTSAVVLPVSFHSFNANVSGEKVNLHWQTSNELNNKGFHIQRFNDGQWTVLGYVPSLQSAEKSKSYSFTDIPKQAGVLLYRLEQIDEDGKKNYSSVLKVNMGLPSFEVGLFPNPAKQSAFFNYQLASASSVTIELFDAQGRKCFYTSSVKNNAGYYQEYVPITSLRKGVYHYRFTAGTLKAHGKLTVE